MFGMKARRGMLAAAGVLAAAALVGCAGAAATGGGAAQAVTSATTHQGCPPNRVRVPTGDLSVVGDVDGDGRADRQFYSLETPAYGIRTASGATIVLHDNLPAPNQHGGWTAKAGGTVWSVVDDGQTAEVFRFAGCRFVPVTTRYGLPFLSVLSGGGYGSKDTDLVRYGLTCTGSGTSGSLANTIAVKEDDGTWRLDTYRLKKVGSGALEAPQGPTSTQRGLKATDRRVRDASYSLCGTRPKAFSDGR